MKTCIALALSILLTGCGETELYFDQNGNPHGTGWKEYHYKSGELMLKEYYEGGQLERSIWLKPEALVSIDHYWTSLLSLR